LRMLSRKFMLTLPFLQNYPRSVFVELCRTVTKPGSNLCPALLISGPASD